MRLCVGIVAGAYSAAVDSHQPPAHHGKPVKLRHACRTQGLLHGRLLLGQDVDDVAVVRVSRCSLPPATHQIGAQQHQQHQSQHAYTQAADLQHRKNRPRTQLPQSQPQPIRQALRERCAHTAPHQPHSQRTEQHKQQHRSSKATHCNAAQFDIAAGSEQQSRKASQPRCHSQGRRAFDAPQLAAHNPQWWRACQLQHGWQAKSQQQRHAYAKPQH